VSTELLADRLFQMVMALTARWRCPAIVQARRGCRPDTMARGSRPVSRRISRQPPAEKKLRLSRRKKIRLAGAVTQVVDGDFAVTMTATLCNN